MRLLGSRTQEPTVSSLFEPNLGQLYREARVFGRVSYFDSDYNHPTGQCHCEIKFNTTTGISLEAKSGMQPTIERAFQVAIEKAKEIQKQFK